MSETKQRWSEVLRALGVLVDKAFLRGLLHPSIDVARSIKRAAASGKTFDWDYPVFELYPTEEKWIISEIELSTSVLPQFALFLPDPNNQVEVRIRRINDVFQPPFPSQKGLSSYLSRKPEPWDSETARLKSFSVKESLFTFQPSTYFGYLSTNLSLDVQEPTFGSLRSHISDSGRLEPLESSCLANIVGINGLIFTSDGYMIYQKRDQKVLERQGMLCSGFSGSIDDVDIRGVCKVDGEGLLSDLETLREGVEELGIKAFHENERVFLGATREPLRGGKPEFFFAVSLNLTRSEVLQCRPHIREGEIMSINLGPLGTARKVSGISADKLVEIFSKMIGQLECEGRLALAFQTNLLLWLRYLALQFDPEDQAKLPRFRVGSLESIQAN